MCDAIATSRILNFFSNYRSNLRRQSLSWISKYIQKVAVYHVFSAICLVCLQSPLEADLNFSSHELWKTFPVSCDMPSVSREHSKPWTTAKHPVIRHRQWAISAVAEIARTIPTSKRRSRPRHDMQDIICLYKPYKLHGIRLILRDCRACSEDEKAILLTPNAEGRARTGLSNSTRGQLQKPAKNKHNNKNTVCHLVIHPPAKKSSNWPTALHE